jgi:hypothetical protein
MKKFLMVLGVILLCLIVIAVVLSIGGAYYGHKFEKSGSAFTDEAINAICSSWDPQQWYDRADPDFFNENAKKNIIMLFGLYSRCLGTFKQHEGSEGVSKLEFVNGEIVVTAEFVSKAVFEKGEGKITAELIRRDGKWQLVGFNIASKSMKI